MKIVCAICQKAMKPQRAVTAIEMASFGPYKLWGADLYACNCGNTVLAGFADRAYAEHYQDGFGQALAQAEERGAFRF